MSHASVATMNDPWGEATRASYDERCRMCLLA